MKTVSAHEMRELDRRTIEEVGIPGEELMRRAGQGVADLVVEMLRESGGRNVLMIAGPGNNGGDVFAAATALAPSDLEIEVWICGTKGAIRGDAEHHLRAMIRAGIIPVELHGIGDACPVHFPDLIVDGLLGTGSRGAPRGWMGSLIDWINEQAQDAQVLSVDLPSGLDADTGRAEGPAVRADCTATMGLPKTGLIRPDAQPYTGSLEVIDIGIPLELMDDVAGCPEAEWIDWSDPDLRLPRRERTAHKGTFGHVLLIGGSPGMTGAIALAARAALRSGAGLVSVWAPGESVAIVAQAAGPEAMVRPMPPSPDEEMVSPYTAVLAGPGMGRGAETERWIGALLECCRVPLVLDADALGVTSVQRIASARCPVVLTPHPGEYQRLFGEPVQDRWAQARHAAQVSGAVVVLKGAGTVVAAPGEPLAVNMTGNPGMAVGGSGDVLAGLLTGLLGQTEDLFLSARRAVYLHGLAGDLAASAYSQAAMTAGDVIDCLPDAFWSLSRR